MLLSTLLKNLANRAGKTDADAILIAALASVPQTLDIPDELCTAISSALITTTEARANSDLKKHFDALALNGLDTSISPYLDDLFEGDDLIGIKADKSTGKKVTKLAEKAKALKVELAEAKAAGNTPDVKKYTDQITTLNGQISTLTTGRATAVSEAVSATEAKFERQIFESTLSGKVLSRTDVNDFAKGHGGQRVVDDFYRTVKAKGGVLDYKTGKIMQAADQSLPLFIDNKEATQDMLLQTTLEGDYLIKGVGVPAGTVIVPVIGQPVAGGSAASRSMATSAAQAAAAGQ
jgi:hypothetical protein